MTQKQAIQLFEEKRVRTAWDTDAEKWWFSIIDCIAVLTNSPDPRNYWKVLKHRLKAEGNETVTNCNRLKMQAPDGKMRLTDVADTEQLFRLIQSIPSPKAEPFKQWMAQVAAQRIDQMQDPELSIEQAVADYRRLGYSEAWINQRMRSIEVRKHLTDEWNRRQGECKTELVRGLPSREGGRRSQEGGAGRGTAVRFADRHHLSRLERSVGQGVQAAERSQERKSARQYD